MLPKVLLDLILSFHRPICEQQFLGSPTYTLYWAYDKGRLKELLGMSKGRYYTVRSKLGEFLRRVPQTRWLLKSLSAYADADYTTARYVDATHVTSIGPLVTHRGGVAPAENTYFSVEPGMLDLPK